MGLLDWFFGSGKRVGRAPRESRTVALPGATIFVPARYRDTCDDQGTTILEVSGTTEPTLRISLLFAESESGAEHPHMGEAVRKAAREAGREVDEHFDGKVVDAYEEPSEGNGTRLLIHYWIVGQDNCMAIISLTHAESAVNSPLTKSVLCDVPAMIDSFELDERVEYLETSHGTVQTKVSSEAYAPPQASRGFTCNEQRQLAKYMESAEQFRQRYGSPNAEMLSPAELDALFARWMGDEAGDKPCSDETANALGAAYGEFVCRTCGMHWEVITDEHGSAWAIAKPGTTIKAFPIESVRKRIESREHGFFAPVFLTIQSHLENSKYAV